MKLNLGCGRNTLKGFINLDKDNGWYFQDGFKNYQDNSIEGITISHALMFLTETELEKFFYEAYRVLEKGGVIRITEDDCENKNSIMYNAPYKGAKIKTGFNLMKRYLSKVGFKVHAVTMDETKFKDSTLRQSIHRNPPDVFFIEGVKDAI